MFPGLNPKKINALMKQMGMSQEEIDASRVIIEKPDGNIIINNPNVVKINMQGQDNFQISGDIEEQEAESNEQKNQEDLNEKRNEDIRLLCEKTGKSKKQAQSLLESCDWDLTEAILKSD